MIGPPGAGKGTQANKLAAKLAVLHVSTGQLLRESVSMGTKLGVAAKHYVGDVVIIRSENDKLQAPGIIDVAFIYDDTKLAVPLPLADSVFFLVVMRRNMTREIVQVGFKTKTAAPRIWTVRTTADRI